MILTRHQLHVVSHIKIASLWLHVAYWAIIHCNTVFNHAGPGDATKQHFCENRVWGLLKDRVISDRNRQSSLWAWILLLHSLAHAEAQHSSLLLWGSKLQKRDKQSNKKSAKTKDDYFHLKYRNYRLFPFISDFQWRLELLNTWSIEHFFAPTSWYTLIRRTALRSRNLV